MRLRWRRRRDLAERLRPYLPDRITQEPMVDADPIRMFLYRWMIETGDSIEVVARGFDLPAEVLEAILCRRVRRIELANAREVAERLDLGVELWQ